MQETEVALLAGACRRLRADAVALEMADHIAIVAMNVYDGTYITSSCDQEAHLPSVVRGLHLRLYSMPPRDGSISFLPAATVQSALDRWERQISAVFGRRFAASLVSGMLEEGRSDHITADSLENVRRRLSSAIGWCIDLSEPENQ